MKKITAINMARKELYYAERAVEQMIDGISFEDFKYLWESFVVHLYRVQNKIMACLHNNQKFKTWNGNVKNTIKSNKWLQYLEQSRHAHEHGTGVITESKNSAFIIESGGHTRIDYLSIKDGRIIYKGNKSPKILPPRIALLPVTNSGKTYDPPFRDAIEELNSSIPHECRNAIDFYRNYINEVESRFVEDQSNNSTLRVA